MPSDSDPLCIRSPSRGQSIFSMLTMCSGIFVPLAQPRPSLEKPAWSEDSLIQSMSPADRQLVCNSSMVSSWAMDFSGLATCWARGWNSICVGWSGNTLRMKDVAGGSTAGPSFFELCGAPVSLENLGFVPLLFKICSPFCLSYLFLLGKFFSFSCLT